MVVLLIRRSIGGFAGGSVYVDGSVADVLDLDVRPPACQCQPEGEVVRRARQRGPLADS